MKKTNNKRSITKLITSGFSIIVILIIAIAGYVITEFNTIKKLSNRVETLRIPTFEASSSLLGNIKSSLSALQGIILIGDDLSHNNYISSWGEINLKHNQMELLSTNWTNPDNVARLKKITTLLDELKQQQNNIMLMSKSNETFPSMVKFRTNLTPLYLSMKSTLKRITTILNTTEMDHEHQNIEQILFILNNDLNHNRDLIELFILTGNEEKSNDFDISWIEDQMVLAQLINLSNHLPPSAQPLVEEYKNQEDIFLNFAKEIIALKRQETDPEYITLMKTQIIPIKEELLSILTATVESQKLLLDNDNKLLNFQIDKLTTIMILSFIMAIIFSFWLALAIIQRTKNIEDQIISRNQLIDQNIMISTLDENGKILDLSNQLCRELGGTKKSLIGTQSKFFLSDEEYEVRIGEIISTIETGEKWEGEIEHISEAGKNKWYRSTIIPIEKNNGGGNQYSNILDNISDKKRNELLSITDKLTGVYNRRHFDKIIDKEIQLARRRKENLTLAIIDIDFFKKFNDHYGHPEGDRVLRQVAQTLQKRLKRPNDYIFRLGGEEFGILFSATDIEQSQKYLEDLRGSIETLNIQHELSKVSDFVTISIGAACCNGLSIPTSLEFYELSDSALYEAKIKRNSVELIGA